MEIFPKEILESTSEYYLDKIKVRSRLIYVILILAFIGGLISLPYVFIELSISARGILTPKTNRVVLYVPVTGSVLFNSIYDNSRIKKADTICIIDPQLLDSQIAFKKRYKDETEFYLDDLKKISKLNFTHTLSIPRLNTEVYRSAVKALVQRLKHINLRTIQTAINYKRDKKLFESDVISSREFEKTTYELNQAKSNYRLAIEEKLAQWDIDEHRYSHEIDQATLSIEQLQKQRERHFLISPISGVIQLYSGMRVGSFVYENQRIAEISPDSTLIAEIYISPTDIGFIGVGKPVRLQVDAFNYNQWGMLDGEILEISDDIIMIEQRPFFLVKCSFQESFLSLKNGYKGYLKKGMTVGGRILINERSLYQLLYDKVDDWLNPIKA